RLPKGRTYGHLADGPRRAQGPRGRPAEPRHRAVGEAFTVRRLDRPRRAGPHDLGRQADAARVLRQDDRLRVQLRQGPGEGRRREPRRNPGRHAGQLRVGGDLGEAPAGPDTDLAGRDDRAQRGHPPGPTQTWLGESIVHSEDIRRALGIQHKYPTDAVVTVADFYKGSNLLIGSKSRIAGLTLRATDANWSHGAGPEVS